VRALAASRRAARRLPGNSQFNVRDSQRPSPISAAVPRGSRARKAGGHCMAPFIGPITTGAPRPNSSEGSRGDTGIGWCTTSMPCSRTSARASRRCAHCVASRDAKPRLM
jgi:hypothetical protein